MRTTVAIVASFAAAAVNAAVLFAGATRDARRLHDGRPRVMFVVLAERYRVFPELGTPPRFR
jgi:hypothetical protein